MQQLSIEIDSCLGPIQQQLSIFDLLITYKIDKTINPYLRKMVKYTAAGTLFTNKKVILAGYQPKLRSISGIGGMKEEGEKYKQTAIRETIEELFHISEVPKKLIKEIIKTVEIEKVVKNGSYKILIYNFRSLKKILKIIKTHGIVSPLYKKIPTSLSKLLLKRKTALKSEIKQLVVLPLEKAIKVSKYLINDIALV